MGLSNKDRILDLLKTNSLTSNIIADKLNLSKQDTRTYLLRLKKEDKIRTLGKRGRQYIYSYKTYKAPSDMEKSRIDRNMLVEVLRDYLESEPNFKKEVNKKIAELEAKLNTLASKTNETYSEIEEELEYLQDIEHPDKQSLRFPEFLSQQIVESPVVENLNNILVKLIASNPEVKGAVIVSVEGEIFTSALPQDVDEATIAVMTAALLSLAESAITLIKDGEFEQLFIRGGVGYLLVLPAGLNAILSVSTSKNIKLGLIYNDCKQVSEQIAKLI
ncbi:MAG: roadblock/LC7 domain-containing protein [Candidatus Lokiarchaeota archaeon]|nr:roadblock/LC7 domain-containing protein [Candidatus Lokiarchaeota archaeon]